MHQCCKQPATASHRGGLIQQGTPQQAEQLTAKAAKSEQGRVDKLFGVTLQTKPKVGKVLLECARPPRFAKELLSKSLAEYGKVMKFHSFLMCLLAAVGCGSSRRLPPGALAKAFCCSPLKITPRCVLAGIKGNRTHTNTHTRARSITRGVAMPFPSQLAFMGTSWATQISR